MLTDRTTATVFFPHLFLFWLIIYLNVNNDDIAAYENY